MIPFTPKARGLRHLHLWNIPREICYWGLGTGRELRKSWATARSFSCPHPESHTWEILSGFVVFFLSLLLSLSVSPSLSLVLSLFPSFSLFFSLFLSPSFFLSSLSFSLSLPPLPPPLLSLSPSFPLPFSTSLRLSSPYFLCKIEPRSESLSFLPTGLSAKSPVVRLSCSLPRRLVNSPAMARERIWYMGMHTHPLAT